METAILAKRSALLARAAAAMALAALGFTGIAQARDNVYWSVGVGSPGVGVNVSNAYPVYTQPQTVYVQPAPVYIQPRPVYIQPRPYAYYYGQPHVVYVQPGYRHRWHRKHGRDHDDDDD